METININRVEALKGQNLMMPSRECKNILRYYSEKMKWNEALLPAAEFKLDNENSNNPRR